MWIAPPDPLRGERHVDVADAERLERAHDGVDERRRRAAASKLFSFPEFSHAVARPGGYSARPIGWCGSMERSGGCTALAPALDAVVRVASSRAGWRALD